MQAYAVGHGLATVVECRACGLEQERAAVCAGCASALEPTGVPRRRSVGWVVAHQRWGRKAYAVTVLDDGVPQGLTAENEIVDVTGWTPVLDLVVGAEAFPEMALLLAADNREKLPPTSQVEAERLPTAPSLRRFAIKRILDSVELQRQLLPWILQGHFAELGARLTLSPVELAIARADWWYAQGRYAEALELYRHAPIGRFRSRVRHVVSCALSTEAAPDVTAWLAGFPHDPVATLACAYLADTVATPQQLAYLAQGIPGQFADLVDEFAMAWQYGQIGDRFDTLVPELALLRDVRDGWSRTAIAWHEVSPRLFTEPVVDELVDRHLLDATGVDLLVARGLDPAYVVARLDPTRLTDDDVAALGWQAEQDRRTAFSGGTSQLQQSALRFLEGDDGMLTHLHQLWPADDVTELVAARESARTGRLPRAEELLANPYLTAAVLAQRWDAVPSVVDPDLSQQALLGAVGLRLGRDALWAGSWDAARGHALEVLRQCQIEKVRDEALNLVACALRQTGDDAGALSALEQALVGAFTVNTAINAALVAAELDPVRAATSLAQIIRDAPDHATKVSAAIIAVNSWWSHQDEFAGLSDDLESLPPVLSAPLRGLVRSQLDQESFREIVAVLSIADSDWLASPHALQGSPWAESIEARFYIARASGIRSACQVFAATAGTPIPQWLQDERDRTLDQMMRFLLTVDNVPAVAMAAFDLLDARVPMSDDLRIPLAALAAREAVMYYQRNEKDPTARLADHRVDLLVWAAQNLHYVSAERRPDVERIVLGSIDYVQRAILRALDAETLMTVNRLPSSGYAQRQQFRAIVAELSRGWIREATKLRPYVSGDTLECTDDYLQRLSAIL